MQTAHVLFIVELQTHILSFLDPKDLLHAALVCRQWSEAALDILWLVIYDFRPLLNLLAPMVLERRTTPQGIRSFIVSIFVLYCMRYGPDFKGTEFSPSAACRRLEQLGSLCSTRSNDPFRRQTCQHRSEAVVRECIRRDLSHMSSRGSSAQSSACLLVGYYRRATSAIDHVHAFQH